MMYVLLIVGFILLIKGADFFVDGASSTAKLLKVPSVIIGLTIVAMGTSAPEAAVSISGGLFRDFQFVIISFGYSFCRKQMADRIKPYNIYC